MRLTHYNNKSIAMKTDYNNTTMLDMVFENRNKEYGAYVLRRDYDKQMMRAMGITVTSILLIIGGVFVGNKLKAEPPSINYKEIVSNPTDIAITKPKEIEPPKPPQNETMAKRTIKDPEMRVVANEQGQDSIPTVEDLHNAEAGLTTNLNGDDHMGVDGGQGTVASLEPVEQVFVVEQPKVHLFVEQMPEFPGGETALMKYLAKNTEYPDREQQLEIQGKAFIKFVVNEDGSVSSATVQRSDSPGFGKEAMRVVTNLPNFKPGKQQGRAVKVQYVLPFVWKLNN